jgi:hypothetical protein
LQISKSRDNYRECKDATTFTKLKLINDGLFDCRVDFGFREGGDDVFLVDPPFMEIQKGQTREVAVFAFPNSIGNFKVCITFEVLIFISVRYSTTTFITSV